MHQNQEVQASTRGMHVRSAESASKDPRHAQVSAMAKLCFLIIPLAP